MGLFRKMPGLESLLLPVMVRGPLPVRLPAQLQSSNTPAPLPRPATTLLPVIVVLPAVKTVLPAILTPKLFSSCVDPLTEIPPDPAFTVALLRETPSPTADGVVPPPVIVIEPAFAVSAADEMSTLPEGAVIAIEPPEMSLATFTFWPLRLIGPLAVVIPTTPSTAPMVSAFESAKLKPEPPAEPATVPT